MRPNNLKRILDAESLTQVAIAARSGVSKSTINKVYNQKRDVAPKTRSRIVRAINSFSENNYSIQDIFPE